MSSKWIGSKSSGFTLAETLISLIILAVISTYTIPKIMVNTQNGRNKSVAKDVAASIAGLCTEMKAKGLITNGTMGSATGLWDFVPFMNYVKQDGSTIIDDAYTYTSMDCSTMNCYKMQNGSMFAFLISGHSVFWNGNVPKSALTFAVDPDAKYSGSATGQGKAVWFVLYYNCRLSTWGSMDNGTLINGIAEPPDPTQDPPYFTWN